MFSQKSLDVLNTCDPRLVDICLEAIKIIDFTVICGHRGEEDQNKAYVGGKSKLKYPQSSHNKIPSQAVDLAPYPINWENRERFTLLAGVILGIAHQKGYNLRWGGAWNGLDTFTTNKFSDLPHFELT